MDEDNPDYLVHEIFSSNFWKDHPLGKPILGTRDTVKRFDRAMMECYYRDAYSPANLVITAAGNLTHKRLADLAGDYFSDLKPRSPMPAERAPQTHARIALRNKKSLEQVHVCLGVPSYPVPHEDRFT
jgi:predicted Zn-dependent peptidase